MASSDDGDETTAGSRCALRRYDKPEGEKPQWRGLGRASSGHAAQGDGRGTVVVRNDVGKVRSAVSEDV